MKIVAGTLLNASPPIVPGLRAPHNLAFRSKINATFVAEVNHRFDQQYIIVGMDTSQRDANTQRLQRAAEHDQLATDELIELLYEDFRSIAEVQLNRENSGHTLDPTALVHEAFLRLIDQNRVEWQGRTHFLAIGAQAMRRVLVDHARRKQRTKRGGGWQRVAMPTDELTISPHDEQQVLAVDEAIRELSKLDPRQALIVELRFFGGMTSQEVASYLGVSKPTVDRQWRVAKAWLRQQLSKD